MYQMRFPDTVTVEKKASKNASHKVTYSAGTSVKCNLQYGVQTISDENGKNKVSAAWIAFPAGTSIAIDDRVTLPDGSQPELISVSPQRNDFTKKVTYIEVYLTRSSPAGSIV